MRNSAYFLILSGLIFLSSCKSDKSSIPETSSLELELKGKVTVDLDQSAQIEISGFFVEPSYSGEIDPQGNFTIRLPESFTDSTEVAFKKYNESPEAQYVLQPTTIKDYFGDLSDINTQGLDVNAALAGKYYTFPTDSGLTIFPFSSLDFLEEIVAGRSSKEGYYYYFVYSDDEFSIKGKMTTDLGIATDGDSLIQQTTYDISGHEGWNILKYSAHDLVDLNDTIQVITRIEQKSVERLPTTMEWLVQQRN